MERPVRARRTGLDRSTPIAIVLTLIVGLASHGQADAPATSREQFDRAIAKYTESLRLDPKNAVFYRARARAWSDWGDPDRAIADYTEAIRLDANHPDDYVGRGNALAGKGEFRDAIADYDEAIRLAPRAAYPYYCRGSAWVERFDYRKAIADFNAAIGLEPTNSTYVLARGAAWSRLGQHDLAIANFDEAIRLAPADAFAYITRATEWEKDLKQDRAMADYHRAIALDPRAIAAYVGRGRIWKRTGEYENAVANFAELARMVPDDPLGHRELAWLLATCDRDAIRDGRRALREATIACELTKWADARCLDAMAAACAEVGDFDAAVKWQTRALQVLTEMTPRADRRLVAWKRQDAEMSHHLYRYQRRLPFHQKPE